MKTNRRLITAIMIAIVLLIFCSSYGQDKVVPFFSLGGSDKGLIIQGGVFYNKVEGNIQYKPVMSQLENNSLVSASIGYKLFDWVTPLIGLGYYSRKDFKAYDADATGKTAIGKVNGFAPLYGLELRHTWWFIGVSHCNQIFFSAGFKLHRKFKD